MHCDSLRRCLVEVQLIGTVKLSGFHCVASAVLDGVVFDPFSFHQDGLAASEVDVAGVGCSGSRDSGGG